MRKFQFRGKTYIQGDKVKQATSLYEGYFFNHYTDSSEDLWYFCKIVPNYLLKPGHYNEHYISAEEGHSNVFEDSIELEDTFTIIHEGDVYKTQYYEAVVLSDVLKKL